jgi:hypothetical protein
MLKLSSLTDELLIEYVSWHQLMSINGGHWTMWYYDWGVTRRSPWYQHKNSYTIFVIRLLSLALSLSLLCEYVWSVNLFITRIGFHSTCRLGHGAVRGSARVSWRQVTLHRIHVTEEEVWRDSEGWLRVLQQPSWFCGVSESLSYVFIALSSGSYLLETTSNSPALYQGLHCGEKPNDWGKGAVDTNGGEILEPLIDCQFLYKNSALLSYLVILHFENINVFSQAM